MQFVYISELNLLLQLVIKNYCIQDIYRQEAFSYTFDYIYCI